MPSSGGQESMNRPSKDASRQLQQRRQEGWNKDGPESLLRAIPLAGQALSAGPTSLLIASLIDLREVCRLSLLCRATREAYGRRSRKACLTQGVGVPDDRRLEYWKCVLNVQKEIADKTAAARNRGVTGDIYESFLFGGDDATKPDTELDTETEAARPWTESHSRVVEAAMMPPSGLRVLSRRGVEGEISRDVGRTFPNQRLFRSKSGPGQNMLANVLKAYIRSNPDVGYCQGMNFVAGSLLLACSTRDPAVTEGPRGVAGDSGSVSDGGDGDTGGSCGGASGARGDDERDVVDAVMESEQPRDEEFEESGEDEKQEWRSSPAHLRAERDVFWLMMALTSRLSGVGSGLGMRELWLPGVPQLKVRVFQFDKLLLQELPRLYNHFRAKQLQLEVLVSQWFLTLFSYSLRPPMLLRVLDLTFTDGWKAMFRFGLARLKSVENTLCELELEGVSRFLRGFRESDPPSPSPSRDREHLTWYKRPFRGGGEKARNLPWNGPRNGPRNCSQGNAVTAVGPSRQLAASIRVLRATGELKVTRSTLGQLQKDFAVQLLKEHLQGEGQWLTRYGSAPEPSPGNGAGVVGGAADGDVGFMGVEAMTRMMLSDAKLLGKLKEDLAGMAAPLQADAQIFRSKITDASERHEGSTRLKASLMTKLINLKEEIDALGERKKLVSDQMHLLLVQFEQDSAREHEDQQQEMYQRRRRRRQQEGKSTTILRQSDSCLSEGLEDSNGSSRSSSLRSIAANGVRVSPMSSSDSAGSSGGTFGPSALFGGAIGGGKLSFDTEGWQAAEVGRGPEGSSNGSGGGRNLENGVDVESGGVYESGAGGGVGGEIRDGVEGRGKEGPGGDDKAALPWIAFPPPSPPPPQPSCPPPLEASCAASCEIARQPAKAEAREGAGSTVVTKAAGAPRGLQAREDKVHPRVDDARGGRGKTRRFRPVVSMMSSGAFSGAGGVAPGRRGGANAHGIARKNADGHGDGHGDDEEEEDPDGTAWKRLAKWVGGGTGKPRSQWFAPRTGVDSSSAPAAMTIGRRSRASLSSPPKARSGNRRQRRSSLPEGNKRQPTLMEELYEDLGELRRRLEHLQNGIDEKSDMYTTLSSRFGRATVEAEEAHELKRALSEQMLQLLLEQEQRLESYLRDWVNFGDDGPGYLAPPAATLGKGSDRRSGEGGGGVAEQLKEQGVGGGGKRGGMGPGVSSGGAAAAVGVVAAGVSGEVSRGVSWGEGGGVLEAFPPHCPPDHRVSATAVTAIVVEGEGGEERDGFENIESWVECGGVGAGGAGEVFDKDAIGISERGQGVEVGVVASRTETNEAAEVLLVPFPSSYENCS